MDGLESFNLVMIKLQLRWRKDIETLERLTFKYLYLQDACLYLSILWISRFQKVDVTVTMTPIPS